MTANGGNRLVLLLIAGIPVTMMLAATWLWYFVVEGELDLVGTMGTANRGTLLQPPRQVDDIDLFDEGIPATYAELEPRWTLAVPAGNASCDENCERALYVTRQIHVAIGKDYNRIRRIVFSERDAATLPLGITRLSDDRPLPADFAALLAGEHRGMKALRLARGGFDALFAEWHDDPSTWYLIDPRGWVMMSYNSDIPYKDVISDLKFLLKNSSG
ncbi:MAG: hypothetical protein R3228_08435 [Halioglobus sp.]|nr:hypothetical protein [Halioglobus sp.]